MCECVSGLKRKASKCPFFVFESRYWSKDEEKLVFHAHRRRLICVTRSRRKKSRLENKEISFKYLAGYPIENSIIFFGGPRDQRYAHAHTSQVWVCVCVVSLCGVLVRALFPYLWPGTKLFFLLFVYLNEKYSSCYCYFVRLLQNWNYIDWTQRLSPRPFHSPVKGWTTDRAIDFLAIDEAI